MRLRPMYPVPPVTSISSGVGMTRQTKLIVWSDQFRDSGILRLIAWIVFAPPLHRFIDDLIAKTARADGAVKARLFLRIDPVEELRIRVDEHAAIIFSPDLHGIQPQSCHAGFLLDPAQRYVRQPPVGIAAAHIAVRANEPTLFQFLLRRRIRTPQTSLVVDSMFVNCNGVKRVLDDTAQIGIVKLVEFHVDILEQMHRDSESADGIPDTDEFDFDLARKGGTESFGRE